MHRYFTNSLNGDTFTLEGDNLHHIKNVVKLSLNTKVHVIFNKEAYLCEISDINDDFITAKIIEKLPNKSLPIKITLIVGMIREQKWDFVLQKATELGVDTIVPVEFKRNVVKIDPKKEDKKIDRWLKICEDASEQSYRTTIPNIEPVVRNINNLNKYTSDMNLLAYEGSETPFKSYLKEEFKTISLIIGPEGGFETNEVKNLEEMGFKNVSLGDQILRAETAPLFMISSIVYEKM